MNRMKNVLEQIMYPIGVCIMFVLMMIDVYGVCLITIGALL